MDPTHLVINHLEVSKERILVGATDNCRWKWELEDRKAGGDAKTLVYVDLDGLDRPGLMPCEHLGFNISLDDPIRPLVLKFCTQLLSIAWEIRKNGLDRDATVEKYFGVSIPDDAQESAIDP